MLRNPTSSWQRWYRGETMDFLKADSESVFSIYLWRAKMNWLIDCLQQTSVCKPVVAVSLNVYMAWYWFAKESILAMYIVINVLVIQCQPSTNWYQSDGIWRPIIPWITKIHYGFAVDERYLRWFQLPPSQKVRMRYSKHHHSPCL